MTSLTTAQKPRRIRRKPAANPAAPITHRGKKSSAGMLVIGIGASAGGLEAFKQFFRNMPADSGMAFVLVQHLDPHHVSMLAELVGRQTDMEVSEAADGTPIAADRVFIIPPDATLTISGGILHVAKPAPPRGQRRPIDRFFSSLAEDQGERAVCIVLSGTGSDGTIGLTKVKEHGGLTMAQAEFDTTAMSGMPHSAAATGLVDHIIPVEDMPATLLEYRQHLAEVAGRKDGDGTRHDMAAHLKKIFALLRAATGHDFSQYKQNTLIRRLQRRMQVLRIDTARDFIERLRKDPREIDLLFRELLIGVTHFFRDPLAFEALNATVVARLLENKGPDDQIRIWVPGCSTGEEVYSIAILFREALERQAAPPTIHIFGTDIDDAAIAKARAAHYGKAMIGMSPARIERWFVSDGEGYCPVKDVREMCVFSVHSLVKDPPFSKLDLISCRNLMIYLNADLQDRVVRTLHYALRPGGYLLLGQSEGVSRNAKLFAAIDKKHRIFQRLESPAARVPKFPFAGHTVTTPQTAPRLTPARLPDRIDNLVRRAMERHSPAHVVIDRNHDIIRFSGGEVGRYLEPSPGTANLNLFNILRKALRPAARAAVEQAIAEQESVTTDTVAVKIDGQSRAVVLIVEPISDGAAEAGICVVAFQDTGAAATGHDAKAKDKKPHADLRALEQELHTTKVQLRASVDELETSIEEMRSANEEYQSVNEELQSSNEELETAKEEMQSVNEELQTINAEMSGKNEMLTRLNSDIKNLLESTEIATIFIDNSLRIKSFTPRMTALFHLRDSDRGRPITEIVTRLSYGDLRRDVTAVLGNLSVVEREVTRAEDDATFIMRIRPYRSVENVIDGVVITFIDITERKRFEEATGRLAAIVESSEDAIIGHAFDGAITSWNKGAEWIFGFTAAEAIGRHLDMLLPQDHIDDAPQILKSLQGGDRVEHFEIDRVRKDGTPIDVSLTISPIKDADGKMIALSTIAREVTARKQAEDAKTLLIGELDHRIKNTLAVILSLIHQTLRSTPSSAAFVEAVTGRILALSRVHQLLTRHLWDRADLRDVIESELAPYRAEGRENIVGVGKEIVHLTPKATLSLAMTLHELATNAAKYGALSTPEGQVSVTWSVADVAGVPRLKIDWVETGGPPVTTPRRAGFGTRLIERTLQHDLEASVRRDFAPEGVRCHIEFSLTEFNGVAQSREPAEP